ncbi:hypothetical protein D3C79_1003420 [compost metagenome]
MLDQQVVFEVKGIEEGNTVDACTQSFYFGFNFLNIAEVVWFFPFQSRQFLLC